MENKQKCFLLIVLSNLMVLFLFGYPEFNQEREGFDVTYPMINDHKVTDLNNATHLPWIGHFSHPQNLAYSAIYDDRLLWSNTSVIVVFGLFEDKGTSLTWSLWHNSTEILVDWEFIGHRYSCIIRLPNDEIPTHVSATSEGAMVFKLPVFIPRKPPAKKNLNLCMKVIFFYDQNSTRAQTDTFLVGWVEMLRLLGVDFFTLYNYSIPHTWNKAIDHYVNEGVVELHQSGPTRIGEDGRRQQLVNIQDCLYRHMHTFRHTLILDMDEVIFPYRHNTLPQLLEHIAWKHNTSSHYMLYRFHNSYFFIDDPKPDLNHTLDLDYFAYRYKNRHTNVRRYLRSWPKSVNSPLVCKNTIMHYCNVYSKQAKVVNVDVDLATVHHYRECVIGYGKRPRSQQWCDDYFSWPRTAHHMEDVALRYEQRLEERMQRVYADIN